MKGLCFLVAFLIGTSTYAQRDTVALKNAVAALDRAVLSRDTLELQRLLDDNVIFGHSNGWVEGKRDIARDLTTGYLVYEKIASTDIRITGDKDWASVRLKAAVKGKVSEKPFDMQLYVLQVWRYSRGVWKLIARQSAKL